MDLDLTPYFLKYEALSKAADQVFERVRQEFPDCVQCREECADCCHALFDLTLIEAIYMNEKFNSLYKGAERDAMLEKANQADRAIHKLKRNAEAFAAEEADAELLSELELLRREGE